MKKRTGIVKQNEFNLKILPLIIVVGFIPLIVLGKINLITIPEYRLYFGNYDIDFFSFYKMIWLGVAAVASITITIISLLKDRSILKDKTAKLFLFAIAVIFVMTTLSTIFSSYPQIALNGFYGRYEGLYAYIVYMILFVSALVLCKNKSDFSLIIKALSVLTVGLTIIGFTQFVGHDIYTTSFGRSLILPPELIDNGVQVKAQLEKSMVYGTLFHSNYLGSFAAMALMIFSTFLFYAKTSKEKLIFGVLSILSFFLLFGSRSRAGMIGLGVGIVFFILINRKALFKKPKIAAAFVGGIIVIALVMNTMTHGSIYNKLSTLTVDPRLANLATEQLKDIKINDGKATIITTKNVLNMVAGDGLKCIFTDGQGKVLDFHQDQKTGIVVIVDKRYQNYTFYFGKSAYGDSFKVVLQHKEMFFGMKNKQIVFLNRVKAATQLTPPEKWGFEGRESLGSARGYIWSRSLPLLKHTLFTGFGPDTFALKFPQDDYVGKLIAYDNAFMIVDKPHNMYLQLALGSGVPAFIAFMVILFIYMAQSFKRYINVDHQSELQIYGRAVFLGIMAYCGAGLFNDSVVSVAPVFWVFLGSGIAVNILESKNVVENISS